MTRPVRLNDGRDTIANSVPTERLKKIAHKTFAGFMALWLSGFLFLIACHAQGNGADVCPLMKFGAHCDLAERAKNAERITTETGQYGIDCCAFIPAFFDKTRTNDSPRQFAVTPSAVIVEPATTVAFRPNYVRPRVYHPTTLLQNDTFLKNRTFRI